MVHDSRFHKVQHLLSDGLSIVRGAVLCVLLQLYATCFVPLVSLYESSYSTGIYVHCLRHIPNVYRIIIASVFICSCNSNGPLSFMHAPMLMYWRWWVVLCCILYVSSVMKFCFIRLTLLDTSCLICHEKKYPNVICARRASTNVHIICSAPSIYALIMHSFKCEDSLGKSKKFNKSCCQQDAVSC